MIKWLTYDQSNTYLPLIYEFTIFLFIDSMNLKNREFSFTFPNGSYLRFQSFDNAEQFQAFLVKNTPVKIDLGAIYSARVRHSLLFILFFSTIF